jgi:hypothetical protein
MNSVGSVCWGRGRAIFEVRVAVNSEETVESNFDKVSHRPWPLPNGRWVMEQRWRDLLFAHGRVQKELLRQHVPGGLKIDTHQGQAWLGVVPFRMEGAGDPWDVTISGIECSDVCLYSADAEGNVKRGEIHHRAWDLQLAWAAVSENSMTQGLGLTSGAPELLHFSRRQDVAVWPLQSV